MTQTGFRSLNLTDQRGGWTPDRRFIDTRTTTFPFNRIRQANPASRPKRHLLSSAGLWAIIRIQARKPRSTLERQAALKEDAALFPLSSRDSRYNADFTRSSGP